MVRVLKEWLITLLRIIGILVIVIGFIIIGTIEDGLNETWGNLKDFINDVMENGLP